MVLEGSVRSDQNKNSPSTGDYPEIFGEKAKLPGPKEWHGSPD